MKDMSPLHIGTGRENYDFSASSLHSDTLTAALAALRVWQGESDDISDFMGSFALSSAFPYVGNCYFLPRGCGKVNVNFNDCDEYISRKKLKSIRYIDTRIWTELASGKSVELSKNNLKDGFLMADKDTENFSKPYKSIVTQRVTVPRQAGADAEPFFFDWTFFNKDAGLYCLTDAEGAKLKEVVSLFELLGEQGIGTDKYVGGGKFSVETSTIEFPNMPETNTLMCLSLYIPHENDMEVIDLKSSHFELSQRGGYISGSCDTDVWHLRKKAIYMFGVGSVFRLKESNALKGKVVDLRPNSFKDLHPVYRGGKPFVLPVKL